MLTGDIEIVQWQYLIYVKYLLNIFFVLFKGQLYLEPGIKIGVLHTILDNFSAYLISKVQR